MQTNELLQKYVNNTIKLEEKIKLLDQLVIFYNELLCMMDDVQNQKIYK